MNVTIEDFNTGWFGLEIGLTDSDITTLIDCLTELRSTRSHFHARSRFEGEGGVGDIEFAWIDDVENSLFVLE